MYIFIFPPPPFVVCISVLLLMHHLLATRQPLSPEGWAIRNLSLLGAQRCNARRTGIFSQLFCRYLGGEGHPRLVILRILRCTVARSFVFDSNQNLFRDCVSAFPFYMLGLSWSYLQINACLYELLDRLTARGMRTALYHKPWNVVSSRTDHLILPLYTRMRRYVVARR